MKIKIVTDSAACISQARAKEMGIEVVPLNITIGEQTFIDGVDIDTDALVELIDSGKDFPKTSQPSPAKFIEIFEAAKEKGEAVLCILMSSKISGTFQAATLSKDIVGYEHVRIVDSMQFVGAEELLVLEAYRLKDDLELDALGDYLDTIKSNAHIYAVVDTLTYLQRGGRLSKIAAFIGNILSFKPIVYFPDGHGGVKGPYRCRKNAYKALFEVVEEQPIDFDYPVHFGYSKDDTRLKEVLKMFYEKYGPTKCIISPLGAGMVTHVGPSAAAIYYVEKGADKIKKEIPLKIKELVTLDPSMFAANEEESE